MADKPDFIMILGLTSAKTRVRKITPNPKDIKAVKESLKLLNKKFNRKESNTHINNGFKALFPWYNNPNKEWILITNATSSIHDNYTNTVAKIIKKKYPDFRFQIKLNSSLIDKDLATCLK